LFTLKGRQVNGINDFFREGILTILFLLIKSLFCFFFNDYLDDIFIASTNLTDLSPTDLQEINIEMFNDTQFSTSRNIGTNKNQLKQNLPSPPDHDTPNTQTGTITVDLKKMVNVRDSGFLDDEDGLSGRDSELTTSRKTPSRPSNNNKQYETVSEDAPTPNDLMGRKLKSKIVYFYIKIKTEQKKNFLFVFF